jgi:hypothetical protein
MDIVKEPSNCVYKSSLQILGSFYYSVHYWYWRFGGDRAVNNTKLAAWYQSAVSDMPGIDKEFVNSGPVLNCFG